MKELKDKMRLREDSLDNLVTDSKMHSFFSHLSCVVMSCSLWPKSILIQKQVWWKVRRMLLTIGCNWSLLLTVEFLLHFLLICFNLSQCLHEIDTVGKYISCFASFGYICNIFIKFLKMLIQVWIFLFLRDVHKQIKNSCFRCIEIAILKVPLNRCSNWMTSSKVSWIPISISLSILEFFFTIVSIL